MRRGELAPAHLNECQPRVVAHLGNPMPCSLRHGVSGVMGRLVGVIGRMVQPHSHAAFLDGLGVSGRGWGGLSDRIEVWLLMMHRQHGWLFQVQPDPPPPPRMY